MSTASVSAHYYGTTCSGTPTHIDFSPSACSMTTDCINVTSDNYSYACLDSTLNASERLEVARGIFRDVSVLLIDRFSDTNCETPTTSSAYLADGKCYAYFTTGGMMANISEDGVTYRSFDKNLTCQGMASYTDTVGTAALQEHSCTKSNSVWIRAYAATTSSSGSTDGSTNSSNDESSSSGSTDGFTKSSNDESSSSGSTGGFTNSSNDESSSAPLEGFTDSSNDESNSASLNGSTNSSNDESSSASLDGGSTAVLSSHTSISTTIGIVAGIVFAVIIAAGIGIWCIRTQRKKKRAEPKPIESQGHLWEDETIVTTRIPREKVILGALLSSGGYGEVYRGWFDGQLVAIKMLPQHSKRNLQLVNAFLIEAKLMASLDHPHVIRFVGVAWNSLTDLCIVSEFVDNGDLRTLLDNYDANHHPTGFDHSKIKIALHVAHALTYLHSLQPMVLHRDLKSRNILVTHEMDAKLTGFGVSRERSDATMTAGVGTSLWMAPEVLLGYRYNEKADVFSFGVVLSELDSHVLPYAHAKSDESGNKLSDTAILQMVSLGRLHAQFSENSMPLLEGLGRACVSMNPAARPSAAEILYRLHLCLEAC